MVSLGLVWSLFRFGLGCFFQVGLELVESLFGVGLVLLKQQFSKNGPENRWGMWFSDFPMCFWISFYVLFDDCLWFSMCFVLVISLPMMFNLGWNMECWFLWFSDTLDEMGCQQINHSKLQHLANCFIENCYFCRTIPLTPTKNHRMFHLRLSNYRC